MRSGAGEGGRPPARGAELARTLPIFITAAPTEGVLVPLRAVAIDEALELAIERALLTEGERDVRRCLRGASGEGELSCSESGERISASGPIIASASS